MFYLATIYSPHCRLGENMTSDVKMATVQEKAMCVLRFFERKSVIKTPLDFFLWECVNEIVYKTPVTSLDELKLRVFTSIERVTQRMLENTWRTSCVLSKARVLKLFRILQY
jgi:hypothetical protein